MFPTRVYQIDPSYLKRFSLILIDSSYLERFYLVLIDLTNLKGLYLILRDSSCPNAHHFAYLIIV